MNFERNRNGLSKVIAIKLAVFRKTSIYISFEELFNIRKNEIPNKIEDFSNALHRIFGLGAPQMEILIMKKLQEKVGEKNKLADQIRLASNLTFAKYIELMRLCHQETEKRQKQILRICKSHYLFKKILFRETEKDHSILYEVVIHIIYLSRY